MLPDFTHRLDRRVDHATEVEAACGVQAMNTAQRLRLLCVGLSLGLAYVLARAESRRRRRSQIEHRQVQAWEGEGGATASQPQVPGASPRVSA